MWKYLKLCWGGGGVLICSLLSWPNFIELLKHKTVSLTRIDQAALEHTQKVKHKKIMLTRIRCPTKNVLSKSQPWDCSNWIGFVFQWVDIWTLPLDQWNVQNANAYIIIIIIIIVASYIALISITLWCSRRFNIQYFPARYFGATFEVWDLLFYSTM